MSWPQKIFWGGSSPWGLYHLDLAFEHFSGSQYFLRPRQVLQKNLRQEMHFRSSCCCPKFPKQNPISLVAQELVCRLSYKEQTWVHSTRCRGACGRRKEKFGLKTSVARIRLRFRLSECWPGEGTICSRREALRSLIRLKRAPLP